MKFLTTVILLCLVVAGVVSDIGGQFSDKQHYEHGEHNPDYDADVFLGPDEAHTLKDLPQAEVLKRLRAIMDKVDVNGDDIITEDELVDWIRTVHKEYVVNDVENQWSYYGGKTDTEFITWDDFKKITYGDRPEADDDEEGKRFVAMLARDKRRWDQADINKDGGLSRQEFTDFLHPEESRHMHEVIVLETMETIDLDGDGYLSREEYIADMYRPEREGEPEPDWVQHERENFAKVRDIDGDGKMGPAEVQEWILPVNYDHARAEANHLIYSADEDRDMQLSKEEALNNYEVFLGSQVTNWGQAIHEEL